MGGRAGMNEAMIEGSTRGKKKNVRVREGNLKPVAPAAHMPAGKVLT